MTVTIDISPATEMKLRELAAQSGKDVPGYIQDLVEKKVRQVGNGGASPPVHGGMSLDEILAPVRQEFEESNLNEDDLEQLVRESIQEVRAAKKGRP